MTTAPPEALRGFVSDDEIPAAPHIPAWVDMARLCREICACENTVMAWVKEGLLPPPRLIRGKRLWKWSLVDAYLEGRAGDSASPGDLLERIKNAGQREARKGRHVRRRHQGLPAEPNV